MSRYSLAPWRPAEIADLIRLGRDYDGGYVVSASSIDVASALVGLGINDDWSFESDFAARRADASIVAVDGSVSTQRFLARARDGAWRAMREACRGQLRSTRSALSEARRWWRTARDFRSFFEHPHRRFEERYIGRDSLTWRELLRSSVPAEAMIFVKMDIEGAEYEVLPELLHDHERITGCAIEFHDCGERWDEFTAIMDRMSEHFVTAHLHGNNYAPLVDGTTLPSVMEVSLVNRRLVPEPITRRLATSSQILGLDMPNRPDAADYELPL